MITESPGSRSSRISAKTGIGRETNLPIWTLGICGANDSFLPDRGGQTRGNIEKK
jgi:hypothetical protein